MGLKPEKRQPLTGGDYLGGRMANLLSGITFGNGPNLLGFVQAPAHEQRRYLGLEDGSHPEMDAHAIEARRLASRYSYQEPTQSAIEGYAGAMFPATGAVQWGNMALNPRYRMMSEMAGKGVGADMARMLASVPAGLVPASLSSYLTDPRNRKKPAKNDQPAAIDGPQSGHSRRFGLLNMRGAY